MPLPTSRMPTCTFPICAQHQRFLRFAVGEEHYQFAALPFGPASAPRVFTKVLAPVLVLLHQNCCSGLPGRPASRVPSGPEGQRSRSLFRQADFGWLINYQKSALVPVRELFYLGLTLDSARPEWSFRRTNSRNDRRQPTCCCPAGGSPCGLECRYWA